jgi:glutathione S-transferase
MELTGIVIGIALIEYIVIVFLCGQSRARSGVAAPAISGDLEFERYFRVQQNTLEQLVVFLPAMWLFGVYVSGPVGAGLGLVFVVGRALYARGYYRDPAQRGPGFGLTILANVTLAIGGTVGAAISYW